MRFLVYSRQTGLILRTGSCAAWDVALQAIDAHEAALALPEGAAAVDDAAQFVDFRDPARPKVRRLEDGRLVALPNEPSFTKMPSGQRRLPG